jgi:hypothetical protein
VEDLDKALLTVTTLVSVANFGMLLIVLAWLEKMRR